MSWAKHGEAGDYYLPPPETDRRDELLDEVLRRMVVVEPLDAGDDDQEAA